MPTSSYLTSRNSSYLSSPSDSYRRSSYLPSSPISHRSKISSLSDFPRRSSVLGGYRSSNFDDDSTTTSYRNRFGVSTRTFSSSTSIPSSSTSYLTTRSSIERDSRKPPIGLRHLRSESRARDLSLDSGYTSSTSTLSKYNNSDLPSTSKTSIRLSTPSLARTLATSGADLYAKYSPSNYKTNCELSRSRSLTDSTVDSLSSNNSHSGDNNLVTGSGIGLRSTSRDRATSAIRSNGSLPAGNSANAKDYLNNHRDISPSPLSSTAASIKVKKTINGVSQLVNGELINSRCSTHSNANKTTNCHPSTGATIVLTKAIKSVQNNNNNNNNNNNLSQHQRQQHQKHKQHDQTNQISKSILDKNVCRNNNINNNNLLCDSIVVSSLTKSNSNCATTNSCNVKRVVNAINNKVPSSTQTSSTSSVSSSVSSASSSKSTGSKVSGVYLNGSSTIKCNDKTNGTSLAHSDSFKKRLGNNPMSPYKNPDFLKCEYDLARSQVINSRSKSATSSTNRHSGNSDSERNNNNSVAATTTKATSSTNSKHADNSRGHLKDSNLNKITIFGVNGEASSAQVNGQTTPANTNGTLKYHDPTDTLDDIKFIDSDENERKLSPNYVPKTTVDLFKNVPLNASTATLPSTASAKMLSENYVKYNTIANGSLIDGLSEFGIAQKAVAEEMSSSSSSASSTSTLSSIDTSLKSVATAMPAATASTSKENLKTLKNTNGMADNARSQAIRSALPPTPSRITSRTLSDSDSFTRSLAASSISDKNDDDTTEGLCGLRNIGNTCFMNSIIQCLGHTKELTRYLKTKVDCRNASTKDMRIVVEFAKLIKEMWSGSTRSVTPSELKSAFSSKHRMYSGCSQQDAQEFLRFFLDALHCALNAGSTGEKLVIDDNLPTNRKADLTWEWYSKVENSVIKDLFVGQLKSSLKCTVCGNANETFDPFWDLSVPLPTSSRCKLESCFDLFIKEEVLDGDEMPTCSKCKTRRKCTKTFSIQRFPKYLAIHLKRFSETRWSKMSNIVEFPTSEGELNMAPYAASTSSSARYTLYGICNHMGSTAGGHYVAVCKHPVTRKWHEFNDNIVSPTSESSLISSSAYVLFYERV